MKLKHWTSMIPILGPWAADLERKALRDREKFQGCRRNLIRALSRNQALIHSIPKSGVTWTLLMISNYCAKRLGHEEPVDFSRMNKRYILHSVEHRSWDREVAEWLASKPHFTANAVGMEFLIHTHLSVSDCPYRRALFLFRNPFDYSLSMHYHFRTARGSVETIDKHIDQYLDQYIEQIEFQIAECKSRSGDALAVAYERIKFDPDSALRLILGHFEVEDVDEPSLRFAIESTTQEKLREYENSGNNVVSSRLKKSFIRDGVPGTWRHQLTSGQANYIWSRIPENIQGFLSENGAAP
ncbi:sulfotransferase domain-containing protein [Wenzhouxiangella sp. EGI_FJ10409]|uniref:sulfotransferase domain-containing protein n=1 Tax=Wenzhouxiangella sp. EGI_FJ10409 TaxID=3243767 RepID=UPI0035DEFB3F